MNSPLQVWFRTKAWLVSGGPRVHLLGYLAVLAVALGLQSLSGFRHAEWALYDQGLKLLRRLDPQPVHNEVVIIAADEASFAAFDEPFALWHGRLGALIDAMRTAQPAVLGLDLVLPAKSFDAVIPGIDHRLLQPLWRARGELKLVVAQTVDDQLQPRPLFPGFAALIGTPNIASATLCFDEDSVVRRVLPGLCDERPAGSAVTFAAPAAAGPAGDASPSHEPQGLAQRMAELLGAPLRGQGLIDYRRGEAFTTVPLVQVLRWQAQGDVQALRTHFGGKPVLVGVVLPLEDRLRAPVALAAAEPGNTRVPGVMLHAQILRSILNHGFVQPTPPALNAVLTAVVCLCWFGHGFRKDLLYWTLFAMLPALGLYALWLGHAMAPAGLLVSAKLAYVARQALESMRLKHQRERLAQAFAGHVDPRLLQQVLAGDAAHEAAALHSTCREATVMWVQWRGCEVADAPALDAAASTEAPAAAATPPAPAAAPALQSLAGFFDAVQQAVQRSGGMVDRFQGSGVLACFGTPLPLRQPARAALEAALRLCEGEAADAQARAGPSRWSIGIASGPVVSGLAPMRQARPFVVLGETVQRAAALAAQAAADPGPAPVRVCARTAEAVGRTRLQAVAGAQPPLYRLQAGSLNLELEVTR